MSGGIRKCRFLMAAYCLLILTMFLLPRFSTEGYSILKHTTSQLGGQITPNAWVMNLVFFLLGAATVLEGWLHLREYWFQKILLTVFGLCLMLLAFFQHAPIIEGIPYSAWEDGIHSLLASAIGFSFTILAISSAFIVKRGLRTALALAMGTASVILSLLMFMTDFTGLFQRLMFTLAFAWLIYFLEQFRIPGSAESGGA